MNPAANEWDGVEEAIARIVAESPEPFEERVIANAKDLLNLLRYRCPLPRIGRGYWPTISVAWETTSRGPLEIEIFPDRLEVYRFYDQRTDIWEERHVSGQPFSPAFLAELPLDE